MKIKILDLAEKDLIEGYRFYEAQQEGLGNYFLNNLYADIESLRSNAGIHRIAHPSYYRLLSRRFPFAIYYKLDDITVSIHAVLDCRRNPAWVRKRLK